MPEIAGLVLQALYVANSEIVRRKRHQRAARSQAFERAHDSFDSHAQVAGNIRPGHVQVHPRTVCERTVGSLANLANKSGHALVRCQMQTIQRLKVQPPRLVAHMGIHRFQE